MSAMLVLRVTRYLTAIAVMVCVWLLLVMSFLDRFIPPFDRLVPFLMPWKMMGDIPPDASLGQRLAMMQHVVNASNRVANYALVATIVSFGVFSIYVTMVYQQRQRRARENELLLLKNREIVRRNEFIRYISATIGHEFKNNLGRIKRRLDLMQEVPSDARQRIDQNMEKLFADIDIFKKISDEREAGLIDFSVVNLKEMLHDLSGQYADLVEFSFQGMPAPTIVASPTLLKTVFENIIDNAVKYKKRGDAPARIQVFCSLDIDSRRHYVSLSFRDQGIGMNEEEADACFYKGKGGHDGWGEGLYFAKYVVGLHAGKIKVGKEYTAPGVGVEIIVNLPYVEEAIDV